MKTKLKKWLKENSKIRLSYFWYYKNIPPQLEDALQEFKEDFFEKENGFYTYLKSSI